MMILSVALFVLLCYVVNKYIKLNKQYNNLKMKEDTADQILVLRDELNAQNDRLIHENNRLREKNEQTEKQIESSKKKLQKVKELYESVLYAIDQRKTLEPDQSALYDDIRPTITLKLHAMDSKELLREYKENEKQIDTTALESVIRFQERFSNKSVSAVYKMAVHAMKAEIQNVLYTVKYENLEDSVSAVKQITKKYYSLTSEASQTITGTITSYLSKSKNGHTISDTLKEDILRLEYLFTNAVKIEYNYYVKREQAKAEQAAIREQMRMEAAEKKALEEERKKIEKEESKYLAEIMKLSESSLTASEDEKKKLEDRIAELQMQLAEVGAKKDQIIHLQNGKAGTVYVISNLGSFGENVFKIGMTRRLDPQERIDELGGASVPFRFDVHSFIFSEDAPALENRLHTILDQKRVNKVNSRKEFFNVSLHEIENLVYEIEPTATFNATMAAEEYRQSLSSDENYTSTPAEP